MQNLCDTAGVAEAILKRVHVQSVVCKMRLRLVPVRIHEQRMVSHLWIQLLQRLQSKPVTGSEQLSTCNLIMASHSECLVDHHAAC